MTPMKISISAFLGCICHLSSWQGSVSECSQITGADGQCLASVPDNTKIWADLVTSWPETSSFLGDGAWVYQQTSSTRACPGENVTGGFNGTLSEDGDVLIGCEPYTFSEPTGTGWTSTGLVFRNNAPVAEMFGKFLSVGEHQICCKSGKATGLWYKKNKKCKTCGASGRSCPASTLGSGGCSYKLQNARFEWKSYHEENAVLAETTVTKSITTGVSKEVSVEAGVTVSATVTGGFAEASAEASVSTAVSVSSNVETTVERSVTIPAGKIPPGSKMIFWQMWLYVDILKVGDITLTQKQALPKYTMTLEDPVKSTPTVDPCTQVQKYQCVTTTGLTNDGYRFALPLSIVFIPILPVIHELI